MRSTLEEIQDRINRVDLLCDTIEGNASIIQDPDYKICLEIFAEDSTMLRIDEDHLRVHKSRAKLVTRIRQALDRASRVTQIIKFYKQLTPQSTLIM